MRKMSWGLAPVLMLMSVAPLNAAIVLDQEFIATGTPTSIGAFSFADFRRAGTVTAGKLGQMVKVQIELADAAAVAFSGFRILDTLNGVPTSTVSGAGTYLERVGNWVEFATSLAVTPGKVFAIEPLTVGSEPQGFWRGGVDTYPGGRDYVWNPSFGDTGFRPAVTSTAYNFRTYVDDAAAVPEPESWALMIGGFALAGTAMRRRRSENMREVFS